ncbi:SulP family inorganic anion transporter [Staphylococcus simiae]|uniref:Putative sulfate permease n=1 Tax=Staphylococcus simiae CCM 7213 = CCUG 51256 TaxID=911238 RepID=G5JKB5_9STAP|nr:SulP family inorganic anion transporter [Staphylococcus simiae]EHJ07369.1 putative sulfate permease [Staphylococcus simiae CCM 7213 = CCUG 51256]PNZ14040.1 SulP family inorganic anion transporter [Staphylococcus simiae]SNV79983.1 sulfate permease [Staphylococcus simiae]
MTDKNRPSYLDEWKGQYSQNVLAGILLALALLPVAIAFSFIVHINPAIGLMTCGLMMFMMSFIGHRLAMVSGPSSGISIVAAPLVIQHGISYLFLATLVMGLILIIFGLCHIDKVLTRIPNTVVMGFMNALGLLLLTTQIKYIFGISPATYIVAILACLIIIIASKTIRLIPAPLIAIIIVTFLTWLIHPNIQYVYDLANITMTLPHIHIPYDIVSWSSMKIALVYGATMAVISVIQTNLTTQMMNDLTQQDSNKDREVLSQGIANTVMSLLGGYGSSGLVGQSKFFYRMGATSRVATLSTGIFLLLCVIVLGPIVGHIPMVVLAVVLVSVSLNTFDRRTVSHIKEAPFKRGSLMLITMALILITNNLAIGVIVGTLIYYIGRWIVRLKER